MKELILKMGVPQTVQIDCAPWQQYAPKHISAGATLCADDSKLSVCLAAVEQNRRAEVKEPNGAVHQDSCLEFFFTPDASGDKRYFNFELNPLGTLHLGLGEGRSPNRIRLDSAFEPQQFNIKTGAEGDRWWVSLDVPYSFIKSHFSGFNIFGEMKFNLYKCGDLTDTVHYLCWNKVGTDKPDYHRPEYFGTLKIERQD